MSTITKEQIEQYANAARLIQVSDFDKGKLITVAPDHMLELARNALASLEAEPVGEVSEQRDGLVMDGTVDLGGASTHRIIKGASKMKRLPLGTKFYTTPPAPANAEPVAWLWSHRKHPSEVSIVRPEDDERAEGAHWSGWSCQALYAEPVTTDYKLPDGWVACSERMPDKGQNVLISVNFDSPLIEPLICSARYTGSTFRRGDVTVKPGEGVEEVTHWMPLPAAPQQEVKP
ncbi:DUF551 domain-containing protein [Citrobacter freundii]|uniref:DUF551 domain-containing protein n=1 Tax=Citrobacter freundii TaxID=546 RepID=UPI003AAA42E8